MKKIKTAEEYNTEFWNEMSDDTTLIDLIKQAQLDILEYAVNKCAYNADANYKFTEDFDSITGEDIIAFVDKQSILKTIDEIKEELNS